MYFCTHCKSKLIGNYLKSALLEDSSICYIACLDCHNVIKVSVTEKYLNNQGDILDNIQELLLTPEDNSESTLEEIKIARSLFEKAGYGVTSHMFTRPLTCNEAPDYKEDNNDVVVVEEVIDQDCDCDEKRTSCKCCPEITKEKENKIIGFIKKLFGKA